MSVRLTLFLKTCSAGGGGGLRFGKSVSSWWPGSACHNCSRLNAVRAGQLTNARSFVTNRGNLYNEAKSSSSSGDVLKSWTKSIISETSGKGASPLKDKSALKRPPVATFQKGGDLGSEPVKGPLKLRRRMADNTWTSVPMDEKIIWVDCEMTGLNPSVDKLIEIGVIVTDGELNVIATQDSIVFHVEDAVLDGMDPWCTKHHGDSGLTESVRNSKITHETADDDLLKFLQKHTTPGECPMAGNSIGQDRGFIRRQLPKFHSHFHYRDIDVSSIKELVRRWHPEAYAGAPRKKRVHRVLDDIRESIEELKYYRSTVFTDRKTAASRVASAKNQ